MKGEGRPGSNNPFSGRKTKESVGFEILRRKG